MNKENEYTHQSPVPTPFNIEHENSSFENTPLVVIPEFEDSTNMFTPKESPLTIPTPMPSPINRHGQCNDLFCAMHDSWFNSVPSPSTSIISSSLSESDSSPLASPTRKKRKKCKDSWSDVRRKCLTNLGKKYISKRGKVVDEKIMGEPCTCRYKCRDKVNQNQRLDFFHRYWSLGSKEKQWAFIIKYTRKQKKIRCLNQDHPNRRQFTYKYCLPILSDSNSDTTTVDVCKNMFLKTLAIGERVIQTAHNKYDGVSDVEIDKRGRHSNHKVIINAEMEQSVCDHVHSFVPIESHYIRQRSSKLYLDGNLSISRMFKLYKEWVDVSKYNNIAKTERQYRDIVCKNFNLGFFIPKKDQCDECHVYRNKNNPTEEESTSYRKHILNKKTARKLKNEDKNAAVNSTGKIITAVFDFEKVLSCPQGQISVFYYKRKLSVFNFTVYDMCNKQATCYLWDETVSKRGSNEVSSCLLDFIKQKAEQGVEEFRFWSDNCGGQNRNRIVYNFYLYAAAKFNVSIFHKFLEKGHTQNEGDSVHALIERVAKTKIIYTPDEWRTLVRWAKTDSNPYLVKNMQQQDFYDFKSKINNKIWSKNTSNEKISWNKIKEVHVDKNDPNKLFYKYDLTETNYYCLIIRNSTRSSHSLPTLNNIHSSLLKISKCKYDDLMHLCNAGVIVSEHVHFYKSLPFENTLCPVNENIDSEIND